MRATLPVPHVPTVKTERKRPRSRASIVRVLRRGLPEFTEKFGMRSLGIFGSYLRGEQKPSSDLDLLVEYREDTPYETRVAFHTYLTELLELKIDLIENKNLKPYIGRVVRPQVVWLQKGGAAQSVTMPRARRNGHRSGKNGGAMSVKREYMDYIQDMLKGMNRAQRYVQGITLEHLLENEEKLDAVSFALQTVGEAANRIPPDVQAMYPEIPWRNIIGMRNWIAHGYDVIEYDVFWETLTESIPRDEPLVRAMLDSEKKRRGLDDAEKTEPAD